MVVKLPGAQVKAVPVLTTEKEVADPAHTLVLLAIIPTGNGATEIEVTEVELPQPLLPVTV